MASNTRYMPMVDYAQIEATAPGRFIISGEYADLYDKNAIAAAVDCRCKVTIKPYREGRLRLKLVNYDCVREWPTTSFTMTKLVAKYADVLEYTSIMPQKMNHLLHKRYIQQQASPLKQEPVAAVDVSATIPMAGTSSPLDVKPDLNNLKQQQADTGLQTDNAAMAFLLLYVSLGDSYAWSARPPLDIEVTSDVPISRGLGSSSAYAVSICAALLKVFRVSAEPYLISNWACNVEKFFHGGSASGLSTSVAVHGGYIYFQNNKVKCQHSIPHSSPIKVMFIDTKVRTKPVEMNNKIAGLLVDHAARVNNAFNTIAEMGSHIWRKIANPEFIPRLVAIHIQTNQELLDSLGLGNDNLTEICSRGNLLKLAIKQTHGGETAFLMYDEQDSCKHLVAFRNELEQLGYSYENRDISFTGLKVTITPKPEEPRVPSKSGTGRL